MTYPEARIPETPMPEKLRPFQAFTEDELAIIRTLRSHEIHVTPDGRLEVWFPISDEEAAEQLHKMLRP